MSINKRKINIDFTKINNPAFQNKTANNGKYGNNCNYQLLVLKKVNKVFSITSIIKK